MPQADLRDFIDKLESNNELQRVNAEVDWNLEVGAITRRLIDLKGPAPLFQKIKDYQQGYRILGLPFGPSRPLHARLALALGLRKDMPPLDMIEELQRRLGKPIQPRMVNDAPCKENIMRGDKIDVLRFPAPLIHDVDGGRFLGTWCIVVTKDPEINWVNWGVYRIMVQDKKTLSVNFEFGGRQHGADMLVEHESRKTNKPYPVAIVVGADPISLLSAVISVPRPMSEQSVAGGLQGSPMELVKCETVDLEVPASSEIVIEGEVPRDERKWEGPFGEFTGHTGSGRQLLPFMNIKCIAYRNDPIITMANIGKPWADDALVYSITYSANIRRILQGAGLPVKNVYILPIYGVIISVSSSEPGLAHKIMKTLKESKCRTGMTFTFIVGDDVDVTSMDDVFWCFTTRLHPKNGIHVEAKNSANQLVAHLTPEERNGNFSYTAYFDCTWPSNWSKEYVEEHCHVVDFENAWPSEVRRKVLDRWAEYGFRIAASAEKKQLGA